MSGQYDMIEKFPHELNQVAENVWTFESYVAMPGANLPAQATLIKHSNGELTIIAPVKFGGDLKLKIEDLGKVTRVIAPNAFHHMYVKFTKGEFPEAKFYCTPALLEKRKDFAWDGSIEEASLPEELECQKIAGSKFQEYVFLHKPSKTLIVADTIFNLGEIPGWGKIFFKVFGTYNQTAMSRLYRMMSKDKKATEASLNQVAKWPFENIIMAHGTPIKGGGRTIFTRAAQARGFNVQH